MIFEFDDCRFDQATCELRRRGEAVPLQPKVLDLLVYLLENRDRVVPKNELLDEIWAGTAVGDGVLTRAINLARQALGDRDRGQPVIQTVPRKGYRFCADVRLRNEPAPSAVATNFDLIEAAFDAREWSRTLELLAERESSVPLDARAHEMRGWCLQWQARFSEATDSFETAHHAYEADGDLRGAARTALQLTREFTQCQKKALAAGWMTRAITLLQDMEECEEHATLQWFMGRAHHRKGDMDLAQQHAENAIEIARRVGSRDEEALGKLDLGHCLLGKGRVEESVALHDEVAAVAMSGGLSLQATGTIYCSVIWGSRNRGDWERAGEWTDLSLRWCESSHVSQFPGLCTLHRGEVLRLQGRFEEAEREVLAACDNLLVNGAFVVGDAYNELGEIRLRRGDIEGARNAFRRAVEMGMDPQPGLARLRVVDGDLEGARKGLERALADTSMNAAERRVIQKCAFIEVALAQGDLEAARETLAHLDAEPQTWTTDAHRGEVEACRGRIALAEGQPADAIKFLQGARRAWLDAGAAYEAARVQGRLAEALEADGDLSGAALEWEAARNTFERTGSSLDAQHAKQELSRLTAQRAGVERADEVVRTFLFTDIVGSTLLVEALGDEDWETLRRWHHRTLQAAFRDHAGEVIGPHEGDGFFVAFESADAAIGCAIAIQRALVAHREQHGFAPRVRIGAHTAEGVRRGGDYAGKGVHVAARVADSADGGTIRVTRETIEALGTDVTVLEAGTVRLKGTQDEVPVSTIDWS